MNYDGVALVELRSRGDRIPAGRRKQARRCASRRGRGQPRLGVPQRGAVGRPRSADACARARRSRCSCPRRSHRQSNSSSEARPGAKLTGRGPLTPCRSLLHPEADADRATQGRVETCRNSPQTPSFISASRMSLGDRRCKLLIVPEGVATESDRLAVLHAEVSAEEPEDLALVAGLGAGELRLLLERCRKRAVTGDEDVFARVVNDGESAAWASVTGDGQVRSSGGEREAAAFLIECIFVSSLVRGQNRGHRVPPTKPLRRASPSLRASLTSATRRPVP